MLAAGMVLGGSAIARSQQGWPMSLASGSAYTATSPAASHDDIVTRLPAPALGDQLVSTSSLFSSASFDTRLKALEAAYAEEKNKKG